MLQIPRIVIDEDSPILNVTPLGPMPSVETARMAIPKPSNLDQLITNVANGIRTNNNSGILDQLALLETLAELRETPGLDRFKEQVFSHIHYLLSHETPLHTVISSSEDKERIASFLVSIWKSLGKIPNDTIRIVSRSNLVASYLGHTSNKTKEVLNDPRVAVIMIEETYTLQGDSFGNDALEVINDHVQGNGTNVIILDEKIDYKGLMTHIPWSFD